MANIVAMILAGGEIDDLGVSILFGPKWNFPFVGRHRIIDFPLSDLMHSGIGKVGILSQDRPFRLIQHVAHYEPWNLAGMKRCATILPLFKGREPSDG